ncbi:hypothetical protein GJW-30_1_00399 [Variibacter gotjawalensis]|uniref:Uncharacterized protein n=1 Tax=Variibacter gotjawalensis TaxID=1333996 RepID=A0A0S3PPJ6_9BRAD|nr:hypothetical protein [Variibacter gotjawalensis]NIK48186.1 hypothetical protein [Variibacter gotjawalensis]RZS50058.1 hypothetical protein EV661_2508 [Variibacter gotjawalensis]BAT57889.1 hypothetical protein GJW-30_1_00399 [Variibacter gotjawalensis]
MSAQKQRLRNVLTAIAFAATAAFAASPAAAKSFTIGDDRPVAVIVVPDSWNPQAIEDGVEATSPDNKVYIAAEAVEIKDVAEALKQAIEFFQEQGITLAGEPKQSETKINGLPAIDVTWNAKDKDGPTYAGLTFVILNEQDSVLLYFWGDAEGVKLNEPALRMISDSLKAVPK